MKAKSFYWERRFTDTDKIKVQGLVKIFGSNPESALSLLDQGWGKEQILAKTRQTVAVNNVNFAVREGEVFVIMGLSGSGKSTVLRCINRLVEPTRGKVFIDDEDVTAANDVRLREIRRKKVGMVFQRFALFPHRTVLDNVAYGLEIQGVERDERYARAREMLALVGLNEWEIALPDQLSGGMQQRVGLARALASNPDILLMDEAFSALDPLIRREMQNELLSLQSKVNKTIIFVTHDLDEALKIGDRIALMKDGSIVQVGTPEEILTRPADEYVAKFVEDVDVTRVLTAEDVMRPAGTVSLKDGPRVALRRMRKEGFSSIFVVTRDYKLAGLITAEEALEASESNKEDLSKILCHDFPTATPETPLNDLIPLLAHSKFPLAVIDDQNRLLGVIVRGALLAALVRKGGMK
ncbi:glycine betaine/L-proline ABC transporter ATP-binding protein [Desulfofundulus sp. TPOSR]|uniref:quaternary amine ABC transporter ATP-binding protein n=1 Tax=Desulfofundulus sp. TPOSR TaxID=2714340 RepID=UPI00140D9002|nr:glycine betaine/L-proline ABC transporter ATP-binding protein [Desulfofundulus sp. TPOSR]NHM25575.1 glycine betaine/L-proline ABC transporter ATP-binding protein [Desulfofundulus sp. TPOSR]